MTLESEVLIRSLADAAEANRYNQMAVYLLRMATQRYPGNASYHYRLGRLLVDQFGAYAEAYGPLHRAVARDPAQFEPLMTLGYVQRKLQRYDEATATYERALGLRPNSAAVLTDLAAALSGAKRYGEVVSTIRRAQGLHDDDERMQWRHVLLADALFWNGKARDALDALEAARDPRQPWDENVLCGLATVWRALGRQSEAARACAAVQAPFVCGCAVAPSHPAAENAVVSFSEQDGMVAAAALRGESEGTGVPGPLLVVEDVTQFALLSAGAHARESIIDHLLRGAQGDPPQVLEALQVLTSQRHVPKRVAVTAPFVRVINAMDLRSAFAGDGPAFYERFPGANGFATISSPVYSKDQTAAVVFVQRTGRLDQHPGTLVALKRTGDAWQTAGIVHASSAGSAGR